MTHTSCRREIIALGISAVLFLINAQSTLAAGPNNADSDRFKVYGVDGSVGFSGLPLIIEYRGMCS